MAKGQVRSNKEIRKPKKDKSAVKTTGAEDLHAKLNPPLGSAGKKPKH